MKKLMVIISTFVLISPHIQLAMNGGVYQIIFRTEVSGIQQLKKNYDSLTNTMDKKIKLHSKSTKDLYNYYKNNFDQSYQRALYLEQQINANPNDSQLIQELQATHMELQKAYDKLDEFPI